MKETLCDVLEGKLLLSGDIGPTGDEVLSELEEGFGVGRTVREAVRIGARLQLE